MIRYPGGLQIAVTGAAGFIGRAVVDRIDRGALGAIGALRLNDTRPVAHPTAEIVTGSYADSAVRARLVGDGIDILFHLASLPGGAAERDPALGRRVNLDGSIALLDAVAGPAAPVIVYTSSIAALGRHDRTVTDATALRPVGGYGIHKAMIELYLADLTQRRLIDGRAVRVAGVVARPPDSYAGFATAWMSDLFHAAVERRAIAVPARADAHIWLQGLDVVADNILHAALIPADDLAPWRAWTLPATVARVGSLVDALSRRTGHAAPVRFGESGVGHPPLEATAALALGFTSDGDIDGLVDAVLARIAPDGAAPPKHRL